jgi:hypothetical protein
MGGMSRNALAEDFIELNQALVEMAAWKLARIKNGSRNTRT